MRSQARTLDEELKKKNGWWNARFFFVMAILVTILYIAGSQPGIDMRKNAFGAPPAEATVLPYVPHADE